jgi:hypothetical protein
MAIQSVEKFVRAKAVEQRSIGWKVFLKGKHIDTVFFDADCSKDYVLRSLISHDGYNPDITIKR